MSIEPSVVQNSTHIEDINAAVGEAVSSSPCVVWSLSVISDAGDTGVVTFHNGSSQSATKLFEVRVAANTSEHVVFPRGKKFSSALWVKSNVSGLDLAIDYD